MIPHLGEATALMAALAWASAVILFRKSGETVHPVALNLFKNSLAFVLFLTTALVMGDTLLRQTALNDYLLLIVSGIIGVGISDTMFFTSLNRLGAGLSAIVDCLYSPFIIGLSVLFLSEVLNGLQIIGVVVIISAVLSATQFKSLSEVGRSNLIWGLFWGVLAMAAMAVSIVMIKPLLERSPLLWVTEIRLLGGIIALVVILMVYPKRRAVIRTLISSRGWLYTLSGSLVGAYLATLLWLAGMKYTQASIAAALNQTSNVLVFIMAALLLGERITSRRLLGIIMGVSGSFMVTFG